MAIFLGLQGFINLMMYYDDNGIDPEGKTDVNNIVWKENEEYRDVTYHE